jgi:hypothetical protein
MPVFLERFLIPLCAAALIGVVVINPMKLGSTFRGVLVVIIIAVAMGASIVVHKWRSPDNPHVQNAPGGQNIPAVQTVSLVANTPPQPAVPITVSEPAFQRVFVVRVGGYQDFTWGSTKIRIEVKAIKRTTPPGRAVVGGEQDHAHIYVSTGGGLVYGGEETTREGVNEFLVPVKQFREEEPRCVLFFHTADNYYRFFRVFVDHINATSSEVTLDACFVRLFNEPPKAFV